MKKEKKEGRIKMTKMTIEVYQCEICKEAILGSMVGFGDGLGDGFVHSNCWEIFQQNMKKNIDVVQQNYKGEKMTPEEELGLIKKYLDEQGVPEEKGLALYNTYGRVTLLAEKYAEQNKKIHSPETWKENEHPSACIHRQACIFYKPQNQNLEK